MLNQPFTWNPAGPGVKIEDTVQLTESGIKVLTVDDRWPAATVNGFQRPVTLQLQGPAVRGHGETGTDVPEFLHAQVIGLGVLWILAVVSETH